MLIATHGVRRFVRCFTWSEVICMHIAMHGVKLYAHSYKWSDALCSLL